MTVKRNGGRVKGRYHSPRREEQARATQRAILDAAHELFLANGYAGTSIETIADRARVSRQTIYDAFGDKAALLLAVGARVVAREDEPLPLSEADAWAEVRREHDQIKRLEMVAHLAREAWENGMVEFESMVFDATASDPRLLELAQTAKTAKRRDTASMAAILFPDGVRRPDVELDDLVDLVVAIDSAAVVSTLVRDLGWTYDKYERWLVEILRRLFLA